MLAAIKRFIGDDSGASTIEYGLMISLALAGATALANEAGARIEYVFRGVTGVLNAAAAGRLVPPLSGF